MNSLRYIFLLFVLVILSSCSIHYPDITGKVVDNATGKPINGALVVAQWTQIHGFGNTYHTLYKYTENLTNSEGEFSLKGTSGSNLEQPEMIIYKDGYIPWRNDITYPDFNSKKHEWNNKVTYKLDILPDAYSAEKLHLFVTHAMVLSQGSNEAIMFRNMCNKVFSMSVDEMRLKNK